MKSWMVVFSQETWAKFLTMEAKVCGFNDIANRGFPNISVGDRMLCYVSGVQVWAGILTVSGARYRSQEKLYSGGVYPNRIPVECKIAFAVEDALPMSALEGKLSFFPSGATGKNWAPHVRISPRIMHVPDAEAISLLMSERGLPGTSIQVRSMEP